MEPSQFKIVSKLDLHPPTEVTEEHATKEDLKTDSKSVKKSKRTSRAEAMKREL